jgi:hypothetical protein
MTGFPLFAPSAIADFTQWATPRSGAKHQSRRSALVALTLAETTSTEVMQVTSVEVSTEVMVASMSDDAFGGGGDGGAW